MSVNRWCRLSTKRVGIGFVLLMSLYGCSSNSKFGGSTVRLSITPDAASAAMTQLLTIAVSGADTTSYVVPASHAFNAGQPQTLDYNVVAGAGALTFTITASAYGNTLAQGSGNATIAAKSTTALTVALVAAGDSDGGVPDSGVPDLGAPADLSGALDLYGVDLGHGPIVATNGGVAYNPNAADLSGVTGIDTTALTITIADGAGNDGGVSGAPPTGVGFVASSDGKFAVLTVGKWLVDKEVHVTGSRPLVVVARLIDIADYIHVEAKSTAAGPGGFGPLQGPGVGGPGQAVNSGLFSTATGGGGAGHGTPGGPGGPSEFGGVPGNPGVPYGNKNGTDLTGGSGGGQGASSPQTGVCGAPGAGGGAIELDANESIVVEASGLINAGGGGPLQPNCSGAGSGGTILFEARSIVVLGILSANGGNVNYFSNAPSDAVVGAGGDGSPTPFGLGGSLMQAPSPGYPYFFGGGGGGAAGRIGLRTSGPYGADVHAASAISPAPVIDPTVP
jgi:hypothetical protein